MSEKNIEKRPQATVGIYIQNSKGEILLISSPKWQDKLVPPGGKIDYGETVDQAVIREAKEETGLDVKNPKVLDVLNIIESKHFLPYKAHFVGLQYKVELFDEEQEVKLDEKEASAYFWLKPEEIVKRDDIEETTKKLIQKSFLDKKDPDSEYKAGWQRAVADYQNLQRETEKRLAEWACLSEKQILEEFLPVYDNFQKALNFAKEGDQNWLKGVEQISKQFGNILKQHGIETIPTVNEQFNPERHEAVGEEESEQPANTVIKEAEAGYSLKGKIIKPAKVIVAK